MSQHGRSCIIIMQISVESAYTLGQNNGALGSSWESRFQQYLISMNNHFLVGQISIKTQSTIE